MVQADDEYRELYRNLYEELLPEMQEEFAHKDARKRRRRLWWAEVGKNAAGSAIGTLIGGATLVLVGGAFGLIQGLSASGLVAIGIVVLFAIVLLGAIAIDRTKNPEEEASRRAAGITMFQIEVDVIKEGVKYRAERERQKRSQST